MTTPSWQKIVSTLAGERSRVLYARAVVGQPLEATAKEVQRLQDAGLLTADGAVDGELFKAVLAAAAPATPRGADRFFRDGRIDGLPRAGQDRADLATGAAEGPTQPARTVTARHQPGKDVLGNHGHHRSTRMPWVRVTTSGGRAGHS